jgi:hypothetical protein
MKGKAWKDNERKEIKGNASQRKERHGKTRKG